MSSEQEQSHADDGSSKTDVFDTSIQSKIEEMREKKEHLETQLKSLEDLMDALERSRESDQATQPEPQTQNQKKKHKRFKQKKVPYPADFDQIFKFQGFVQHRRSTSFVINGIYSLSLVHRDAKRGSVTEAVRIPGCLVHRVLKDGSTEIEYPNGSVIVERKRDRITYFVNGDIQHEFEDQSVAYFYSARTTLELSIHNGAKVFFFPEGRKEIHWPDGKKEIYKSSGKQIIINKGTRTVYRYERRKRQEK